MAKTLIKTVSIIAAAVIVTASLSLADAQQRRQMAAPDILRVANVGDAQISPNGQWAARTEASSRCPGQNARVV